MLEDTEPPKMMETKLENRINFGLLGVGGYIAPKHLKAIKEVGGNLVAALDKNDSVGIIDSYFPEASFFTEFERFERYCEKHHVRKDKENQDQRTQDKEKINYISICTPNYLHDAHIRFGLRIGADVICEKPLVLNPWNLESLLEIEKETNHKVYTVLQSRLHPKIRELKERVEHEIKINDRKKYDVEVNYVTPRGKWYMQSWKSDISKSGGIATNIGIHLFDMLIWIFGDVKNYSIGDDNEKKVNGFLNLKHADITFKLSLSKYDLPSDKQIADKPTQHRQILIDGEELDFTSGFADLHTEVYKNILAGKGHTIQDALPSIQLVSNLRNKPYRR